MVRRLRSALHIVSDGGRFTDAFGAGQLVSSLACFRGIELDRDDRVRREVIGARMCSSKVYFGAIYSAHGVEFSDYFATELDTLAPLAADGLVEVGPESIVVTPRGRLLMRTVAMTFDLHLREQRERARSSRVI